MSNTEKLGVLEAIDAAGEWLGDEDAAQNLKLARATVERIIRENASHGDAIMKIMRRLGIVGAFCGDLANVVIAKLDRLEQLERDTQVGLKQEMTAAELEDAIAMAFSMVGRSSKTELRHEFALSHLRCLLLSQQRRAERVV